MGTYLVTGAAGFIGSALAMELVKQGHTVVTVDNLSTGIRENIPQGVILIEGNAFDPMIIAQLDQWKFDTVFHLAGQSGGVTCWDDPVYDLNSNVTSTLLLLEYCKKSGCHTFVYASSMSVYGDENPCPVREGDEIKPKSFYAVGKHASEHYMRIYAAEAGMKCTALRLNNTYGPGQSLDFRRQGMVRIFVSMAVRDHFITIMGDENRYRDFVYISDVVRAFLMAAEGKEPGMYHEYTVATNRKTTCGQLVRMIVDLLPFEVKYEYKGSTRGDQFGIFCSYEKIYHALGWEPQVSLEEGLKTMTDWALSVV